MKINLVTALFLLPISVFAQWLPNGTAIYNTNTGNVGIGPGSSVTPLSKLHIFDGNGGDQLRLTRGTGSVRFSQDLNQDNLYLSNRDGALIYMHWKANGNVGIGTITPATKLDVKGGISIENNNNLTWGGLYGPGIPTISSETSTGINFYPGGSTSGLTMRIHPSGKVGLGTTNPQTLLNVSAGAGDATVGTPALRIGGTNNYPSLEFGIKGSWDGMISTYGNDLHVYAGNWRTAGATATENHNISFYTSQAGSSNWNTAKMYLRYDGNVGIGTINPDAKLAVKGTIHAEEVKVDLNVPVPDYVFKKDYDLHTLAEVENYINQNKHLPEVPAAKEMEANGINLGEMNMLLLKKIEELTLYVIELKKENEVQNKQSEIQQREIESVKNKLKKQTK